MDNLGFPRTADIPVKLLGTCVRYQRSVETTIDARGPDFLGGSAIESLGMSSLVLIGALRCIRKWNCLLVTTSFLRWLIDRGFGRAMATLLGPLVDMLTH